MQLPTGGFINSVLCHNLCPLLDGGLLRPFANPFQIPSSQLGTGEVKMTKQIGPLANPSGEGLAGEEGEKKERRENDQEKNLRQKNK